MTRGFGKTAPCGIRRRKKASAFVMAWRLCLNGMRSLVLPLALATCVVNPGCESKDNGKNAHKTEPDDSISAEDLEAFFDAGDIAAIVWFDSTKNPPEVLLRCGNIDTVDWLARQEGKLNSNFWADEKLVISGGRNMSYIGVFDGRVYLEIEHHKREGVECRMLFETAHRWMKRKYGPNYGYYPYP